MWNLTNHKLPLRPDLAQRHRCASGRDSGRDPARVGPQLPRSGAEAQSARASAVCDRGREPPGPNQTTGGSGKPDGLDRDPAARVAARDARRGGCGVARRARAGGRVATSRSGRASRGNAFEAARTRWRRSPEPRLPVAERSASIRDRQRHRDPGSDRCWNAVPLPLRHRVARDDFYRHRRELDHPVGDRILDQPRE